MNGKQLGILVVLVLLLGGAGLVVYKKQQQARSAGNTGIGKKLLSDLPLNEITEVTVRNGTNVVRLVKKENAWRVSERQDYPADFGRLSEFLLKARDLKAVQSEQVGPSQLSRLNLAPGDGTNSPVIVEFKSATKPLNTLVLGKMHLSKPRGPAAMGGEGGWPDGRYIQVGANPGEVAVVSEAFENIEPRPEQWLNKEFIRIEKPSSIELKHSIPTNSWKLTRETESSEWQLADLRAEEKLDTAKIASVTTPFSGASFNDVQPGPLSDAGQTNAPTLLTVRTFDGFSYVIRIGEPRVENYPVGVQVSAEIPKERQPAADEPAEEKTKRDKEFADRQQALETKFKKEKSLENWTFLISTWTVESLLKSRSDLLAAKDQPESGAAEPASEGDAETNAPLALPGAPNP
jgi:hypothetical protein